ncbi:FAD-binding protein [Alteromonas hispanica]|uniref:FAD-binding protein n=1 Tax=Alteromonas hispanica TaxID=315421 RepID=A0A6L9MUY1_9ALTE|nr:FAD-binding protein [Alteromonas hispanica]NDW21590.1 FAD-binding protein [Alteromonas hispanica]
MNKLISAIRSRLKLTEKQVFEVANNMVTEAFPRPPTNCIFVKIETKEQIAFLLELAHECADSGFQQFSIYPISTGRNWGYGSSSPNITNTIAVVLDLSGLKDIKYFDAESGIVTVTPGVTQQQLYDFLQGEQAPFMVPVTGAGPTTSILGNALERGYGITPVADHFSAVTAIKGFLADGSFYESSLQAMSDTATDNSSDCYVDKTFKWKHGPYLDGIFTQSGNIIVTEITIALARKKPAFDSFYMRFFGQDSFENAYDIVKEIFNNLEGVVGSINLMDKRRVCAMVAENPQGKGNHAVMTEKQVDYIAKKYDVPEWTIVGTIYGTEKVARAAKKDVKAIAKRKADQILFSSSLLIKLGVFATRNLPVKALANAKIQLEKLHKGMDVMQGKPSEVALPLAYWRNSRVSPNNRPEHLNPAKDGCGLLWYAPLVPARTADMKNFIDMVRSITPKYNIEPMITFTNLSGISTDSTIPIVFDLENPQAVRDAHACLNELVSKGLKQGFIPYRLNIKQQQELNANSTFWKTAGEIAHALDPKGIISPDRYNPYKIIKPTDRK